MTNSSRTTSLTRVHRGVRYSAWTGTQPVEIPNADETLEALSDALLAEGIEPSLTQALHQGIERDSQPDIPGLDHLRDRIRAEQRTESASLDGLLDEDALTEAAGATTDDSLRRLLNALRAHAPILPGLLNEASPELRAELQDIVAAAAPGHARMEIAEVLDRLVQLGELERQVRTLRTVDDISAIDLDLIREVIGQDAADNVLTLSGALQAFRDSGYVQTVGSRSNLSARAVQKIGDTLLQATLTQIRSRVPGDHALRHRGHSHEPSGTTREYQFGDPFELNLSQTVLGAVKRQPGTPVQISQDDLRIIDREASERAATILAIDLSRSMGERGYLLAAKKLALALSTFIRQRHPQDELQLIGFSESARPLLLQELVDLQWDRYGFGTNVQDALRLSANILNAHRGKRRNLVLITDGEPTAHRDAGGRVVFNHPPTDETVARTFREAQRLRRDGVYLCVCLMSAVQQVANFGTELARHAAGDAIVTDPDHLSADLIVTYSRRSR